MAGPLHPHGASKGNLLAMALGAGLLLHVWLFGYPARSPHIIWEIPLGVALFVMGMGRAVSR